MDTSSSSADAESNAPEPDTPRSPEERPPPEVEATPSADAPDTSPEPASPTASEPASEPASELAPEEAAVSDGATDPEASAEAPKGGEEPGAVAKKKGKKGKKRAKRKRPPPRPPEPPLSPELRQEAEAAARADIERRAKGAATSALAALDMLRAGLSLGFIGRFRRDRTNGMDERRLRALRDDWGETLHVEERRVGIREILRQRHGLTDEVAAKLARARRVAEMEDLAAPYLPVVAGRATVARGLGLQPLADAVRQATEATPLSEVAKPFVPEGAEGAIVDQHLAAARDIVAEELSLDPKLRAKLRDLFRREARLTVGLRTERKGDAGRHASLIGYQERAPKVPPLKILAMRRAEKERVIVSTIEPPEEMALAIVHEYGVPEGHPHQGFLRAASEDGYRRILKPLLQNELRNDLKLRADEHAMEGYERTLRHLLLGPYAGRRRTLGLRPDVMQGHRWCAIDEAGLPVGAGTLPHEPTAGREACLDELRQVLRTYESDAIAIGTTGGRAEALSLAREATKETESALDVVEVADGGTRALESMGTLEVEERPPVPAECRGAYSLARRFQDPLAELVRIDPKALALGPHMHDVHQGRLRTMLHDVIESCVAHVGPDPNRADEALLARVPGFTRNAARALVAWRTHHGSLEAKAQLAAVDGVGPEIAEQAVGFLRLPTAADPRDRTQLHPEQYGLVERMAEQVSVDLPTLFSDPRVRAQVKLDALVGEDADIHALKYVLFQATAGSRDPRPAFAHVIPPPPEITLETLQPGLILQGKVLRAAPFGVFVDCGLGCDALIPTPHIGERPGIEPATVAPVGAVITAQVLDKDVAKKKLTLTMRRDVRPGHGPGRGPGGPRGRGPRDQGPRDQGPRGQGPKGRGPREDRRPAAGPARKPVGAGAQRSARSDGPPPGQFSARGQQGRPQAGGRGQGRPQGRGQSGAGRGGKPRKKGKFGGGGFGMFDRGRGPRGGRDGGGPRNISLKPDEPEIPPEAKIEDESKLSPEELMKRKLEQMKRKLQGGDR